MSKPMTQAALGQALQPGLQNIYANQTNAVLSTFPPQVVQIDDNAENVMKVEDTYRTVLIDSPPYKLYIFPTVYIQFTPETLPDFIKYKLAVISANTGADKAADLWDMPDNDNGCLLNRYQTNEVRAFGLILSDKQMTDIRDEFLKNICEKTYTKDYISDIIKYRKQQYTSGWTQAGQLSGAAQQYAPYTTTTTGTTAISGTAITSGPSLWNTLTGFFT